MKIHLYSLTLSNANPTFPVYTYQSNPNKNQKFQNPKTQKHKKKLKQLKMQTLLFSTSPNDTYGLNENWIIKKIYSIWLIVLAR